MSWKAIGKSVGGTSHTAAGKGCEDALQHLIERDINGEDVLICCASDGAGSALYAGEASAFCTSEVLSALSRVAASGAELTEAHIYSLLEDIYEDLQTQAASNEVELNEYSCTLLGCYITGARAVFFQIGDGAVIRDDASGAYTYIWWPQNGEYQNATSFLIDDKSFGNLNITILEERIDEVALFTDGLQMLALNNESKQVHQPFFTSLFPHLRVAGDGYKTDILNRKLEEYLDSKAINDRTDDDKTLFLATRL